MKTFARSLGVFTLLVCSVSLTIPAQADLITNPPMTITRQVTINPVVLSNTDASNTAEFFGSAAQQSIIEAHVNTIWAQAGIQVIWQTPEYWNDDFGNIGNPGFNNPRPTSDLGDIVSDAATAGFIDADPNVINLFFVEIAAGFGNTSENTANGLAFLGGNGITQHVGDNLVGFAAGQELVASVVAHEIGHNLGLPHLVEAENLMQEGGAPNQGERLNTSQILIARSSSFAQSIPEPASGLLLLGLAGMLSLRQRHRHAA